MTEAELKQIRQLDREIRLDDARIKRLKSDSCDHSALIGELEHKKAACEQKRTDAVRYIASVSDSITRQAMELRYIDGYGWMRAAMEIGGGNTADGLRMRVYREIRKNHRKRGKIK